MSKTHLKRQKEWRWFISAGSNLTHSEQHFTINCISSLSHIIQNVWPLISLITVLAPPLLKQIVNPVWSSPNYNHKQCKAGFKKQSVSSRKQNWLFFTLQRALMNWCKPVCVQLSAMPVGSDEKPSSIFIYCTCGSFLSKWPLRWRWITQVYCGCDHFDICSNSKYIP